MSNNSNRAAEETTLYVLRCRNGKYYVGSTNNLDRRFAEHLAGNGSAWTSRHPPIEVVHQQRGTRFMEDALVYQYMSRYGPNNVRGGTHSSVNLDQGEIDQITRQLRHAGNQCFNCGSPDHFSTSCPALASNPEDQREHGRRRRVECTRCGRDSHTEEDCFAATHADGGLLMPEDSGDSSDGREAGCARCGRDSHDVRDCYASTDIQGRSLSSARLHDGNGAMHRDLVSLQYQPFHSHEEEDSEESEGSEGSEDHLEESVNGAMHRDRVSHQPIHSHEEEDSEESEGSEGSEDLEESGDDDGDY